MNIGDTIEWMALNGIRDGIITGVRGEYYVVRLRSGKYSLVHSESIRNNGLATED